jgi:hypothetical protein
VASFLASAAYFGSTAIWMDFLHSLMKTLNGGSYPLENGNFSLSALVFGGNNGPAAITSLLLLLAGFSWLMFASRQNTSRELPDEASRNAYGSRRMHTAFAIGGGGCAIMLLSSPLVWLHYYLLLLPLSLYVIQPANGKNYAPLLADVPAQDITSMLWPFVLLSVFSDLTQPIVGNDIRIWCFLIIAATAGTMALASNRIWRVRRA